MTSTQATPAKTLIQGQPFSLVRLALVAAAAAAANALVFAIGAAAGASMGIDSPGYSQITLVMAIFATLMPLLLAGGVTWLIARSRPAFRRIAQWLGLAVALLSIASPFLVAQDIATGVSLAAMHLVAGLGWFFAVDARASHK